MQRRAMSEAVKLTNQDWLTAAETRSVLAAIGGEGRFVGGCVRNALLGAPDVDIATPLKPDEVMRRLQAAGLGAVGTGIEHGTVTAIANKRPFEITTLRRDVATDGRRATVAYTDSWAEDASRRDFTMNALYADASGAVYDPVSGLPDLKAGRVRFIGDAAMRIKEDYLRILRLFRFHAWYGKGEIDGVALNACAAARGHIKELSGERIQKEMLRLLEAEYPLSVLRKMAASGILAEVLAGELNFDRLEGLCAIDTSYFFAPDPLLRLAALVTSDEQAAAIATRWRLSNDDRDRLRKLASSTVKIVSYMSIPELQRTLYRQGLQRIRDLVRLRWSEDSKPSNAVPWRALLAIVDSWTRPVFPLTGRDVMNAGVPEGPLVGRVMTEVEDWWVDSNFTDDPFSIAERLKAVAQGLS
jgi:poly(A) polymerase